MTKATDAIFTIAKQTLDDWPEAIEPFVKHVPVLFSQARQVYPEITYPVTYLALDLGQHLFGALDKGKCDDIQAWLSRTLAEDFYLANACAAHDEAAIEHFERVYGDHLQSLAHRYANEQMKAADLLQMLRQKLIVGDEKRGPKLKQYAGQGALRSWLKVTAARTFIDINRSGTRQKAETLVEGDYFERLIDDHQDLELDYLKSTYREAFKQAFARAIEDLSPRERNLLSQSLVGGLSVDKLGKLYNVHRATAARWIVDARTQLVQHTRRHMQTQLQVNDSELDSIMHMIRSRASVSISRLLRPEDLSTSPPTSPK